MTVDLAGYYLQVNGTLVARGTADNKISFTSVTQWQTQTQSIEFMPTCRGWNDQTNFGTIIENAVFTTTGVSIQGCSPGIVGDTFNKPTVTAIKVAGGRPTIANNTINSPGIAEAIIADNGIMTGNQINVDSWVDVASLSGDVYFVGNVIEGGGWDSVSASGNVIFMDNTVSDSVDIAVSMQPSVAFEWNNISNSKIGIEGAGSIQNSTVTGNKIGIQITDATSTEIDHCDIYNNAQNNIFLTDSGNVNARYNWWGTTDTQAINQTIHDFKNDFNLGAVIFVPFLTSAANSRDSSGSPSPPPNSSPETSPNPTDATQPTQPPDQTLPTQTPSSSPRPLNGDVNPLGGSDWTQLAEAAALVVVAMLVAVLIILTIKKRTNTQNAAKAKTRRKTAKRSRPKNEKPTAPQP